MEPSLSIVSVPREDGRTAVQALSGATAVSEASFTAARIDEAHILYMEATELLKSRLKLGEDSASIRALLEKLFALFRGEKVFFSSTATPRAPSGDFVPNPGRTIDIDVEGTTYLRLPVRTRLITTKDHDLMPLLSDYVAPYLEPGDLIFISEKVLTITQGRVVDMSDIKPTWFARFLARNVGNYYGSSNFHGFGHGTSLAMQLFVEEAGYPRVFFAALVSALTRPFGIRGLFYRICGKSAKSIDCPMSFLILEYAHSAKLAPLNSTGVAKEICKRFSHDAVIVDANYRGAFSLGKSNKNITEKFIGQVLQDNPAGQSAEMTPFFIIRKKV